MKTTESAGGVIQNIRGEIVLVRHGSGVPWWGFPKGHLDAGEDALSAARREIFEETGLKNVALVKDLGSYERYKGKIGGGEDESEYKNIHLFLFRTTEEALAPIDPAHPESRWVAEAEVAHMLSHPKDKIFWLSAMSCPLRFPDCCYHDLEDYKECEQKKGEEKLFPSPPQNGGTNRIDKIDCG